MSFYQHRILPHLVHLSMRQTTFAAYRKRIVPAAEGRVLEIGVGSGLNLPFYSERATHLIGLDPSAPLLSMAGKAADRIGRRIELLEGSAEEIPLDSRTIDTVVITWTLCSVPDVTGALREIRRILRADGRLLFIEHGRSPDGDVRRWQDRLTPLWKRVAGGCHLNRPVPELMTQAGFDIERIETGYMKGPKAMTFMYEGRARLS
jgi:ubiquinone/menaquinone biosynthesis C-methylase UbiE